MTRNAKTTKSTKGRRSSLKATAVCHGAASILNAIATGRGSAYGISLMTKASVELSPGTKKLTVKIKPESKENPALAKACVSRVLNRFKLPAMGGTVVTESTIPISCGLKSSSTAANAIILAATRSIGKKLSDAEVVKLGVLAAKDAKVTVTGAFDDACASYYGGAFITENKSMRIIKKFRMRSGLEAVIFVPRARKIRKGTLPLDDIALMAPAVEHAYAQLIRGKIHEAMMLNTLAYSSVLDIDMEPALAMLKGGAYGASLSGTGPAFVGLVPNRKIAPVQKALKSLDGDVIITTLNYKKARVI